MGGGGSLKRRAAFGVLLAGASLWFWQSLPEPLFSAPLSSALYARDGRLLGARIAADGQWRFAPSSEVSEKFSQALMLYEDQRFLAHPGVDPLAIARAARQNWRASRVVSGGSTLTMQVARLSRGNPPRSWGEKLREALLALRLELRYSKPELLALYAAHAPFGGNVVGLEAAAWRYFGHAPAQLSWAEAATLAVLPNSPALIHPARGRAQLQAKRDRLLASLHERGALDALGLQLAQSEALPAAPLPLPRLAPHLLDSLTARQGALHTRSSLDPALQEAVAARLNAHLRRLAAQGVHNGAALIFDNRDFSTLAYVGNRSDTTDAERGYAVDLVQRPRSTGSLLKPLLYAAQLEAGQLSPRSLIPDTPMRFLGFTPENFDRQHRGAVRAQEALALSLNVPAVHNLRDYGVAAFYDLLRQLGLSSLFRTPDGYGLTLVLGGAEASLWELAASTPIWRVWRNPLPRAPPPSSAARAVCWTKRLRNARPPSVRAAPGSPCKPCRRSAAPRTNATGRASPAAAVWPGRPAPVRVSVMAGPSASRPITRWPSGSAMPAAKAWPD